jgi:hypothetical protein
MTLKRKRPEPRGTLNFGVNFIRLAVELTWLLWHTWLESRMAAAD